MEFNYVIKDCILVPEEDLNEMAERVKNGESIEYVVDEYIIGLDDCEYYNSFAFDYKIIKEVRRRARLLLKNLEVNGDED